MRISNGWLQEVRHVASPNYNARPPGSDISLLVIHNISLPPGKFEGDAVERFFTNGLAPDEHPFYSSIADMRVSAHCFVRRNGEIIQFVSFVERAWHAGRSSFCGETECNDFAIGVELEGTDSTPYTDEQYASLASLTEALQAAYPKITKSRITGHADIAPERKTDPGPAFDWSRYFALLP
ncbi:1,6-anhydro-N-acetylmuramyl-L-alanine amidase AmpD [Teredinibacter turnerae]|uniref:1,6-anhydro-N-acetylmuramyl-L-alanine amidase AmpD n=1 Tax=Teredinibacter turnerae TaxID=2426 RepID=UPI0003A72976|nr:1,6-anhydro-N-acetylmuramyl-L-alanine amidase AmpD [Teredinibacter turnerae]